MMFKNSNSQLRKRKKEAGAWIGKLDRGLSDEESKALESWLYADPGNARELEKQQRNWQRLDSVVDWKPEHSLELNPDLLAPSGKDSTSVLWISAFGLAAAAALAFAFIASIDDEPEMKVDQFAKVSPEENGTIGRVLSDGTRLLINADTAYEVVFSEKERRIILREGDIYFDVAKNPVRPFIVETVDLEFTAVGTAFDVKVSHLQTRILVEEGIVSAKGMRNITVTDSEVSDQISEFEEILSANQLLTIDTETRNARIESLTKNAIIHEFAWQHRKLVFREQSLASVIAEFNRLNDVEIIIQDQDLTNITISGNLDSSNVDGLLNLLHVGFGISNTQLDGFSILLSHSNENNSI